MTTGIYKLTFLDDSFYIGKSTDIAKRWDQHTKNMQKGTHTVKVQSTYNMYGPPSFDILFECHADHIDIMEAFFINAYWSDNILNTTRPAPPSEEEIEVIRSADNSLFQMSTFSHMYTISSLTNALEEMNNEIKEMEREYNENLQGLKDGTLLAITEKQLKYANDDNIALKEELHKLKNRGLLARIFNIGA